MITSLRYDIMVFVLFFTSRSTTANFSMNFTIKTLWNSIPIASNQFVQLTLSSTPNHDHLRIDIDAPFFNDSPPCSPAGPLANLWNYEVVELFFLASSTNHYIELEFSPHGHYLVLLLTDRRQLLKDMLPVAEYRTEIFSDNHWYGTVRVPRAHFPAHIDHFNAYAIHGEDEKRIYEALYPAPIDSEKPDFHRLELFQPLNFESLLDVGDVDGSSWHNQASPIAYDRTKSFKFFILFFLMSQI